MMNHKMGQVKGEQIKIVHDWIPMDTHSSASAP